MAFPLSAETIVKFGFFKITNSSIDTIFVDVIIVLATIIIVKNLQIIPGFLQNATEAIIEAFYSITQSVSPVNASRIFPYFMSFFFFIVLANWTSLIPGVGSVGFFEGKKLIPLVRSATSDLNTTLGLALVSAAATHIMSVNVIGIKNYINRYFSLNPINLFIGLLEIISEITKVISLSFRLFGNIFAGEVVLGTVATIFAFVFPLPFLLLETIVGLVQALVFSMLTMAFMAILTTPHHESEEVNTK